MKTPVQIWCGDTLIGLMHNIEIDARRVFVTIDVSEDELTMTHMDIELRLEKRTSVIDGFELHMASTKEDLVNLLEKHQVPRGGVRQIKDYARDATRFEWDVLKVSFAESELLFDHDDFEPVAVGGPDPEASKDSLDVYGRMFRYTTGLTLLKREPLFNLLTT